MRFNCITSHGSTLTTLGTTHFSVDVLIEWAAAGPPEARRVVSYLLVPPSAAEGVHGLETYALAALSHFDRTERPIAGAAPLRFGLNDIVVNGALRLDRVG